MKARKLKCRGEFFFPSPPRPPPDKPLGAVALRKQELARKEQKRRDDLLERAGPVALQIFMQREALIDAEFEKYGSVTIDRPKYRAMPENLSRRVKTRDVELAEVQIAENEARRSIERVAEEDALDVLSAKEQAA